VAQVVEHLLCKHKALSSNTSLTPQKRKENPILSKAIYRFNESPAKIPMSFFLVFLIFYFFFQCHFFLQQKKVQKFIYNYKKTLNIQSNLEQKEWKKIKQIKTKPCRYHTTSKSGKKLK
jgi:hypothetical protein